MSAAGGRPRDDDRAIPYFRIKELCPPLTKPHVRKLIASGVLRAIKRNGVVLIEANSVREWFEEAPLWRPTR